MATLSIPLTQGKFALIDEEDLPLISPHKWCAVRARSANTERWYAMSRINRKNITMHRLLMGFPPCLTDHKNGDGLDNRRSNIRKATSPQNGANSRTSSSSGFRGVSYRNVRHCWEAYLYLDGDRVWRQRSFPTAEDAARGYDEAARHFHGEFAFQNLPGEADPGAREPEEGTSDDYR